MSVMSVREISRRAQEVCKLEEEAERRGAGHMREAAARAACDGCNEEAPTVGGDGPYMKHQRLGKLTSCRAWLIRAIPLSGAEAAPKEGGGR